MGRFLVGHPGLNGAGRKTAREWKLALEERSLVPALSVLHAALSCLDPRVALDAAKEIKNTLWGKPTEKVQQEVSTKPAVMPSDEQLERLAQRVIEERAEESEGVRPSVDTTGVH